MRMNENTRAQQLLLTFCERFGWSRVEFFGAANALADDPQGRRRNITVNIFGDIMDADRKKIIAVGNTSHDIRNRYELPTDWKMKGKQGRERER